MDNMWGVQPLNLKRKSKVKSNLQSNVLGTNWFSNKEKILPDVGNQKEASREIKRDFDKNKTDIVKPIIFASLKKHPTDVLHGSASLKHALGDNFSREPGDFDIFSTAEKSRAQQIEKAIDKKVGADIVDTVEIPIPKVTPGPEKPGEPKVVYRVMEKGSTPAVFGFGGGGEVADYMHRPPDLETQKVKGITIESLSSQYERLQKRKVLQPMKAQKAISDMRDIRKQLKSDGYSEKEIKDMNYEQAKSAFPGMKPYVSYDGSGIPAMYDCKPFDSTRAGPLHDKLSELGGKIKEKAVNAKEKVFGKSDAENEKTLPLAEMERKIKESEREKQKSEKKQKSKEMQTWVFVKEGGRWRPLSQYSQGLMSDLQKRYEAVNKEFDERAKLGDKSAAMLKVQWKVVSLPYPQWEAKNLLRIANELNKKEYSSPIKQYAKSRNWKKNIESAYVTAGKTFDEGMQSDMAKQIAEGPSGKPRMAVGVWGSMRQPQYGEQQPVIQPQEQNGQQTLPEQNLGYVQEPAPMVPQKLTYSQTRQMLNQGMTIDDIKSQGYIPAVPDTWQQKSTLESDNPMWKYSVAPYRPVGMQQTNVGYKPVGLPQKQIGGGFKPKFIRPAVLFQRPAELYEPGNEGY